MNEMTEGHTVKRFDGELAHLHGLALEIGELVQDQLKRAIKTLEDEDPLAAQEVIDRDEKVNALDVRADDELVRLLAKRQPVAKDLREALTVSKIVTDLERVGDEARKVANLTIDCYGDHQRPPVAQILRDMIFMSNFAGDMLKTALESFDELDLQKAVDVIRRNEELEEEFRSCLRRLSTFIMEDARSVGHMVDVVLGLRALERIGGHAKNIAGYTVFLVKGKDVRHEPLETVELASTLSKVRDERRSAGQNYRDAADDEDAAGDLRRFCTGHALEGFFPHFPHLPYLDLRGIQHRDRSDSED